jgi:hypothetical protein
VAGFNSPLFLLGLAGLGERAGYRSPLPIPSLGADAIDRAGFVTPLPFYFGYAGDPIEPPEPPPVLRRRGSGSNAREEEELIAVILAAAQRWG